MRDYTERIWKEYRDRLHSFIEARVDDTHTADDVLQEVFVRIHSQVGSLRNRDRIQSWVCQITRNAIIDHYRVHKRLEELPVALAIAEPELRDKARGDIDACIMPMIQGLPEPYREAVMLSEIEGLTQKEVAEKQGITLSGAKSRVQRGRTMIKDMLFNCCKFEFDHQGNVMDYDRKDDCRDTC
ncbi:MAG: RNA polymerase sigma factor SigZ [Planctomycetota bacterium]